MSCREVTIPAPAEREINNSDLERALLKAPNLISLVSHRMRTDALPLETSNKCLDRKTSISTHRLMYCKT